MAEDQEQARVGVLDTLVGYHLRRASGAFSADFTRTMDGTGMRQVLFAILAVIEANPRISQGAVGRTLAIKRANMVSLVNELIEIGFVDREAAADDRRAFALMVTPAGSEAMERALRLIRSHEERLLGGLTAGQRRTLGALLNRIERSPA